MAVDVEDCVVCAEPLLWVGIGQACAGKHQAQVCSACTLRLRLVLNDKRCCICQKECQAALVVSHLHNNVARQDLIQWDALEQRVKEGSMWKDKQADVYFADREHFKSMQRISRPVCLICQENKTFQHKHQLEAHLKKEHKKYFCGLCLEGRHCFIGEQKLYTAQELKRHVDRGEPLVDHIDGANGFKGHPCCKFCHQHFYGEGEIYYHMERSHEHCFLCRQDNPREYTYYKDYPHLEKHFVEKHHVCTHQDCREQKFVVFRTAEELKRHRATKHPGSMSKAEKKKAMQLQTCFTTTEKKLPRAPSLHSISNQTEDLTETSLSSQVNYPQSQTTGAWASAAGSSGSMGNLGSSEEFPSLAKRKGKGPDQRPSWVVGAPSKKSQSRPLPEKKAGDSFLSWQTSTPSTKPPPGFASSRMRTVGSAKSLTTVDWPQIDRTNGGGSREASYTLSNADDDVEIKKANKLLVQNIKEQLGSECFASFRDATAAFQRGEVDGDAYMSLIDNLGLGAMVADIAGLCPDPSKKDELLSLVSLQSRKDVDHGKQRNSAAMATVMPPGNPTTRFGKVERTALSVPSRDNCIEKSDDCTRDTGVAPQGSTSSSITGEDMSFGAQSQALPELEAENPSDVTAKGCEKKEKPRRRRKELSSRPVPQAEGSATQFLDKASALTRHKRSGEGKIP